MITWMSAGAAMFVFVFLKAFQQRNVAFDHYLWVFPTSLAMAATEVYVIAVIALEQWTVPLVLFIGSGAGLGAMAAMWIHRRYVTRRRG